jgi:hypothetical protein
MELALSSLKQLQRSAYFSNPHTACDGVWFDDHPACRDGETWASVKDYLVQHGYLAVESLSLKQVRALNLHPKDEADTWWFRLTAKGADAAK